eukprot:EG_transcript_17757
MAGSPVLTHWLRPTLCGEPVLHPRLCLHAIRPRAGAAPIAVVHDSRRSVRATLRCPVDARWVGHVCTVLAHRWRPGRGPPRLLVLALTCADPSGPPLPLHQLPPVLRLPGPPRPEPPAKRARTSGGGHPAPLPSADVPHNTISTKAALPEVETLQAPSPMVLPLEVFDEQEDDGRPRTSTPPSPGPGPPVPPPPPAVLEGVREVQELPTHPPVPSAQFLQESPRTPPAQSEGAAGCEGAQPSSPANPDLPLPSLANPTTVTAIPVSEPCVGGSEGEAEPSEEAHASPSPAQQRIQSSPLHEEQGEAHESLDVHAGAAPAMPAQSPSVGLPEASTHSPPATSGAGPPA